MKKEWSLESEVFLRRPAEMPLSPGALAHRPSSDDVRREVGRLGYEAREFRYDVSDRWINLESDKAVIALQAHIEAEDEECRIAEAFKKFEKHIYIEGGEKGNPFFSTSDIDNLYNDYEESLEECRRKLKDTAEQLPGKFSICHE